jgi:Uma2 family endonuclease
MALARVRLWTVDEYHRMLEAGILGERDRVELLEGQIVEMSPQLPPHASTTQRTARYFDRLLENRAYVRMQLPITLRPNSEPEPDVAVVQIDPNEYSDHHPRPDEILLIIEVADTTLESDRKQKALTYAKAGIADYWVLDVSNRQVYVFRQPTPAGYQQETRFNANTTLPLICIPEIEVLLNQLFP